MKRKNMESRDTQRRLLHLLNRYVEECRPPTEGEARKSNPGKLPTVAGFCRFLGIGQAELEQLDACNSTLLDRIRTVLEDELLNHSPSPTLLNTYMKRRLGYGEERVRESSETACGQMRLIFEHDIEEDGA